MKIAVSFLHLKVMIILLLCSGCAARGDGKSLGATAAESGDYKSAYNHWLPLAEKGDVEVQEAVALLLISDQDIGVDSTPLKRQEMAAEWMILSAKGGRKSAMLWLGQALENSWMGFPRRPDLGECWIEASEGMKDPRLCKLPK